MDLGCLEDVDVTCDAATLPYTGRVHIAMRSGHAGVREIVPTVGEAFWLDPFDPFLAVGVGPDERLYVSSGLGLTPMREPRELLDTPPCWRPRAFGWSAVGELVYDCEGDIRRGSGIPVREGGLLEAVLPSGRFLVNVLASRWRVFEPDGTPAELVDAPAGWRAMPGSLSTENESAFVAFVRLASTDLEPSRILVFRVDAARDEVVPVRHVALAEPGALPIGVLPLSDGRVLVMMQGAGGLIRIDQLDHGAQRVLFSASSREGTTVATFWTERGE